MEFRKDPKAIYVRNREKARGYCHKYLADHTKAGGKM